MKSISTLKVSLILIISCIYLLSTNLVVAQDKNIYEISENTSSNDRKDFYSLAFNLKTTVYLKNNTVINTYGNGAVLKVNMEDTNSYNVLITNQNDYDQAELITIKVDDISKLSNSIDLTTLTETNNLKYVFIKCSFKCQHQDIENFIKVNPNIRVFYNAQNPS